MVKKRKQPTTGRQAGGHNKGYWYRAGRGWYATDGQRKIPMTTEAGDHLKDPDTPTNTLQEAHARYVLRSKTKGETTGDNTLIRAVCLTYLDHCKTNNRPSTYQTRATFLYDFCTGLPAKFRGKGNPTEKDRIHKGYGGKELSEVVPLDIEQWLDKHPTWSGGTRRIAVKSVKRAINYYAKATHTETNPLRGIAMGKAGKRITYFTPEIEARLYENAKKPLALAIKVCIRTGVRYGSEFCRLTAKHIEETKAGMRWRFPADESKNGKPRIVYVAPDIAEIVRAQVRLHPTGTLFRNHNGKPWSGRVLTNAFNRLKHRLKDKGIKLGIHDCLYSTRHTFAKRVLGGYWSGKPATIEQVAGLLGNTREICWENYAQWCDGYVEPLWEAVKGN